MRMTRFVPGVAQFLGSSATHTTGRPSQGAVRCENRHVEPGRTLREFDGRILYVTRGPFEEMNVVDRMGICDREPPATGRTIGREPQSPRHGPCGAEVRRQARFRRGASSVHWCRQCRLPPFRGCGGLGVRGFESGILAAAPSGVETVQCWTSTGDHATVHCTTGSGKFVA